MKEKTEGFYKSQSKFQQKESSNYSICIRQIFDVENDNVLEWRTNFESGKIHIIQFYSEGIGYEIYKS